MKRQIQFVKFLVFHPVEGFWQLQRENKGSIKFAFLWIALWVFNNIFARQATGFLFNLNYSPVNIFNETRNVLILAFLFCASNWAVTTLMDGESTVKDIFMTYTYASLPIFIIGIPVTVFSRFATFGEAIYIDMLSGASYLIFAILLFIGIMTINQYSIKKTVLTTAITLVTAGIIVFVFILFFSILSQLTGFVMAMYKEINLRF